MRMTLIVLKLAIPLNRPQILDLQNLTFGKLTIKVEIWRKINENYQTVLLSHF